jgi:putative alpha-1,2-mannosidase
MTLGNIIFSYLSVFQWLKSQSPNLFIGTAGHGHTYPGATTPFGLVQLSPDTDDTGWDWCSGYNYQDSTIMGLAILTFPARGYLILLTY